MLIILLVLLLLFGGWGFSPYNTYGARGYSPVLLIAVVLIVFLLLGHRL